MLDSLVEGDVLSSAIALLRPTIHNADQHSRKKADTRILQ